MDRLFSSFGHIRYSKQKDIQSVKIFLASFCILWFLDYFFLFKKCIFFFGYVSALVFSRANIDLFFPFTAVIFEFDLILPFPVTCISPIHLYLIFEKSSSTNWIFNLQKSISKLIFAGYTGSKISD